MVTKMRKNGKPARMRRAAAILAAVLGTAVIVSGCGSTGPGKGDGSVRIGVSLYDQYDTFISELMASFNSYVDSRKSEGVEMATIVAIRLKETLYGTPIWAMTTEAIIGATRYETATPKTEAITASARNIIRTDPLILRLV